MKFVSLIICFLLINPIFGQKFVEFSSQVGLHYIFPGNDKQQVGAGITVFDFNNDGWDDIFQPCGIFPSKLWMNNKGKFVDVTEEYNLDILDHYFLQGACAADFNNDGYEDLFVGNSGNANWMGDKKPALLLKNVRGKRFEPVYEETFSEIGNFPGATWGDVNQDGYVDLFLYNYIEIMANIENDNNTKLIGYDPDCNPNRFYLSEEGLGFKAMEEAYGLQDEGCGLAALFTDYDNDNDIDLIMLNDFGAWNHLGNRLYRNEFPKQVFLDMSDSLGFYAEFYGMSVGPGDINNDGYLDYYLTNIGRNYFYLNKESKFTEMAESMQIDATWVNDSLKGTSWSGIFFDVENDGDVDLFVSKGYLESLEEVSYKDENKFFINENGSFRDISKDTGINDSLINRGAALIDYDHDGDLDIVSGVIKSGRGNFRGLDQKIKLYKNVTKTKNKWLGIKLVGENGVNRSALGCSVSFELNGKKHIREVDSGSGHSSQSTKTLYFGLGANKTVRNIEIQWIGGGITEIDKLKSGKVYEISTNGTTRVLY